MVVVSIPPPPVVVGGNPWTNQASGVAARASGVTTHTSGTSTGFTFGFTPTSGRLLVLFAVAGVTHTASTGWTSRQGPVNSAELAVFTRIADGGANDTLTITHNAANYPMAWAIYEFPAAVTYTNSSSATATGNTFPALGSLPGTSQFVIAAYGAATSAASTGGDSTVTAPWVEYFDSYTAFATTDGCYLYVFSQPGVTATSITPALTTTLNVSATDRQKVVIAVSA